MKIKEAEYKKVKVMQKKMVSEAVYGCDECGEKIDGYPYEGSILKLTVFHKHTEDNDSLHFCSWKCVLDHLPKINTNYFVDLPFLYYDKRKESKRSAKALIDIINEGIKKPAIA